MESSRAIFLMVKTKLGKNDIFFVQPITYVGHLEANFSKIGGYIKNLFGPCERPPLRLSKMVRHLYLIKKVTHNLSLKIWSILPA